MTAGGPIDVNGRRMLPKGQKTKAKLLARAQCMAERGEPLTFRSLAKQCDVHASLVHYYFGSMAKLMEAAGLVQCDRCNGTGHLRKP